MVTILKKNNEDNKININYDDECSICFESIKKKDVAILNCKHQYHYECIGQWMSSIIKNKFDTDDGICPICEEGNEIENIICREKHIPIKKIIINNNRLLKKRKKCIIS
jgi:hypothetical protein